MIENHVVPKILEAMETKKPFRTAYLIGLCAIPLSLFIYLLSAYHKPGHFNPFSNVFFINFFFCIGYFILLLVEYFSHPRPRKGISLACWMNLVVLFTISAFSLNQSLVVFAPFPGWLNVYTVMSALLFLVFPHIQKIPDALKIVVYLLAGSAFVLGLHLFLFIAPLIPLSLAVFWFFGISLHTFVPLLWLFSVIRFLFIPIGKPKLKYFTFVGLLIPLAYLGFYLYKWNTIQTQIKDIIAEKSITPENHLPDAIALAQQLPSDPLADEIIISPFKSQARVEQRLMGAEDMEKFHDPLATIGTSWFGKIDIDQNTAEAVLNIRQDARHKTSRRLWTGISLSTATVANNVQIFAGLRLAYQEKTITIHNDPEVHDTRAWFTTPTQEAVYTFHLPQGSFVTSLSLWIDGKECKSRLSTRQKADSAYSTIVGVEQRDPALVHWQEGNRISVTVFPCTPQEDRKFKIGFTTPLIEQNGLYYLENVWFEGPDINNAREITRIAFAGNQVTATDVPAYFSRDAKNNFIYKGDYEPYWKIGMKASSLSSASFNFNGYKYHLEETKYTTSTLQAENIYLDMMCEWTREEFDQIMQEMKGRHVYVWLPEKTEVLSTNQNAVWEQLSHYQFSLPYLHTITHPQNSVVLTKSGYKTPTLADLDNSPYADETAEFLLHQETKIKVFNIGGELSPFWRSLLEMRSMEYARGNLDEVMAQIKKGTFTSAREDSSMLALPESHLSIVKEPSSDSLNVSTAPDHLLRLFAYNDVLRQTGDQYFGTKAYSEAIFREAEEGYVVTPVTSMVVLESEADYKRMGIDENKNTVGNAGILGGGAVPEPHEWALIGLVVIFVSWQIRAKRKKQSHAA